ncbi:MAG: hypothetical protein GX235_04245 [Clostridiales bacterium]|nr:hypothetical protein [Clostridiales bacterium]
MEITEFCEEVKSELEFCIGEEVSIDIKKITKNNGVVLNSVVIAKKGRNVSPNIYLDRFFEAYEQGKSFGEIIEEIIIIYKENSLTKNLDMNFFTDYGKMKGRVAYKIIGYEKNKEILEEIPHFQFLDMAVVFYCNVSEEEFSKATILIYNNHLRMWDITKETLYEDAKENTKKLLPARIVPIEKMMREIFSEDLKREFSERKGEEDEFMPDEEWFDKAADQLLSTVTDCDGGGGMYVMGNENKLFGAVTMLYDNTLQTFSNEISKDLFILPSSIHEVILIPDDGRQEAEELWRMVCEINNTQVDPEDVLTDAVYHYSRKENIIIKLF